MRVLKASMLVIISFIIVLVGMILLKNRNYYMTSLIFVLYTLILSFKRFDNKKINSRRLVILATLISLATVGRIAFSFLPQFKPVIAMIIIISVCFGAEIGFMSGAMIAFVSDFFFGQGPWTPWQMFCFGLIGFFAGIIFYNKKLNKNVLLLCFYGAFSTIVIYGGIMNPISVMLFESDISFELIMASYITGITFDIIHAISTIVFLIFLANPMVNLIERIKIKYGLEEVM